MEAEPFISVNRWGKDHWSILAYIETCCVDRKGILNNERMRCHPRLRGRHIQHHRDLVGIDPLTGQVRDGGKYPTRIKDGEVEHHDDWSCLEDMIDAGLVEILMWRRAKGRGGVKYDYFGGYEVMVGLTEAGYQTAAALRKHLSEKKTLVTFRPTVVVG